MGQNYVIQVCIFLISALVISESTCQCRRPRKLRFDSWVKLIPWRRKWQPTPVLLPGGIHGQRSLAGFSPWGHKESDMAEAAYQQQQQKLYFNYNYLIRAECKQGVKYILLNWGLLHCRLILYELSYQGMPYFPQLSQLDSNYNLIQIKHII